MPDLIFNFLKQYTLLESYFISNLPQHVKVSRAGYPQQANIKDAFSKELETKHPFSKIDWNKEPFSNFRILVDAPPRTLGGFDGQFRFTNAITVSNWNDFIDSHRQLRNNIAHGAKFLTLPLGKRDIELTNAGIEFINFLNDEKLINTKDRAI